MRTRVKICGITCPEDGVYAASQGVDAIGLVFYPPSPRAVNCQQAKLIADALPPFVATVALFVNATVNEVSDVLAAVRIDVIQFHGDETPEYCEQFGRPYLKAIRMRPEVDLNEIADQYASAQALLLDTYRPGVAGGTGETFNWDRVPHKFKMPIILAGGLSPENVGAAIKQASPYAVDISGGVEATKGIKDAAKVTAFMRGVTSVEVD